MKPNRFIPIFLFLLAGLAGLYTPACRQDAVLPVADEIKPGNMAATDRGCPGGYCLVSVTVDADADFTFCGQIYGSSTSCSIGCNPGDVSIASNIMANQTYEFCVATGGSFCIQNAVTGNSIGVTVWFGSSTPIQTTIPQGGNHCFNTNGSCSETNDGC